MSNFLKNVVKKNEHFNFTQKIIKLRHTTRSIQKKMNILDMLLMLMELMLIADGFCDLVGVLFFGGGGVVDFGGIFSLGKGLFIK